MGGGQAWAIAGDRRSVASWVARLHQPHRCFHSAIVARSPERLLGFLRISGGAPPRYFSRRLAARATVGPRSVAEVVLGLADNLMGKDDVAIAPLLFGLV